MTEQILRGLPASPGLAGGPAYVLNAPANGHDTISDADRPAETERALAALAEAAEQIRAVAERLSAEGNAAEAEIVETGTLMAADPGLAAAVRAAIADEGAPAAIGIVHATNAYADALAALDDEVLRLRADDVRSLGRRAAAIADGDGRAGRGYPDGVILVARELGPADVAEIGTSVRGVALAAGGVMAHAAIVARSLGIPMVVGVGEEVLGVPPETPLVVDGGEGSVALAPGRELRHRAQLAAARRLRSRERSAAARALPAETTDGQRIRVLANVASATEVGVGLGAGAEGVGLLRTELRFLEAAGWPSEDDHRRQLAPVLGCLSGMTATVRLLDFGGDKTPPFLAGTAERGIGLLLAHPDALAAQLRAIVAAGAHTELRILLPMVERPEQIRAVRELLAGIDGGTAIPLGAMVETAAAAREARSIAASADFLSIGTNDLTHSVLSTDRFAPGESCAHNPVVLHAIAKVLEAAAVHNRIVEVCGEAAGDPITMPLLLGLGVDELSVGAARVGSVRAWVRSLEFGTSAALAIGALALETAEDVAALVRPSAELLGQLDDEPAEGVERSGGIVAVGGQP